MKIYPMTSLLFHADGRTDRHDKSNVFSQILRTRLNTFTTFGATFGTWHVP